MIFCVIAQRSTVSGVQSLPFPPIVDRKPRSKEYRERAEEARTIAETFNNLEIRAQVMTIASDYDRMAERAERHEASRLTVVKS